MHACHLFCNSFNITQDTVVPSLNQSNLFAHGKTISYSKPILNQHLYFWISKCQQTSIFSAGPFAPYGLPRQVHNGTLHVLGNVSMSSVLSPHGNVTAHKYVHLRPPVHLPIGLHRCTGITGVACGFITWCRVCDTHLKY